VCKKLVVGSIYKIIYFEDDRQNKSVITQRLIVLVSMGIKQREDKCSVGAHFNSNYLRLDSVSTFQMEKDLERVLSLGRHEGLLSLSLSFLSLSLYR
jgi:hypothetical protein